MFRIDRALAVPEREIQIRFVRSRGAGGQNVNKVASAAHLRFDIRASSLPEEIKQRLLALDDRRISKDGVIVIKAERHRHQDRNRADALERLRLLIRKAARRRRPRKPTRPTQAARRKRLENKIRHGRLKALRRRVSPDTRD